MKTVDVAETIEDPETWFIVSFSIARELFRKIEPKSDSERIDDLSIDLVSNFIKQYILMRPSQVEKLKGDFYNASERFFEKNGVVVDD